MIHRSLVVTIVIIFSLFTFFSVNGQEKNGVNRSNEAVVINGKAFFIHIVGQKETLSEIAKAYNVPEKEIMLANRELLMGIQVGQAIKIPVASEEGSVNAADSFKHHTIEKHQTLYNISKLYNVSVQDIIDFNPQIQNGPKVGTVIKIPTFAKKTTTPIKESNDNWIWHQVESGQTLYTISQTYNTSIEKIQQANPGIIWDLPVGQKIKIPKVSKVLQIEQQPFDQNVVFSQDNPVNVQYPCEQFKYNSEAFKVALLLPFECQANLTGDSAKDNIARTKFFKESEKIVEYYEGILLASDSIRRKGMNIEMHVFDTERNDQKVKEILQKPEFKEMDLILGPAYASHVKIASDFAKEHQINIVSPLSQNNAILKYNPYILQVKPSNEAGIEKMTGYLTKYFDQNFIVIHNNTKEELDLIQIFKTNLMKNVSTNMGVENVVYKEIDCSTKGTEGIEAGLSVGLENYIFIPSIKEPFVNNIITKLYTMAYNYKIVVIGMPDWQFFMNIEQENLHYLQFHFFTPYYIDYSKTDVKNFVLKYREVFKTEPSQLSLQGFDMAYFFLSSLMKYGKNFENCISSLNIIPETEGIQTMFNFQRFDKAGGFENKAIYILRYTPDYRIERVDTSSRTKYFHEANWKESKDSGEDKKNKSGAQDDKGNWKDKW